MIENPEEKKVQIQPIAELIDETSGLEALTPEDHVAETSGLEALATEDHVDETLGLEALAPEDRVAETSDLEALAPEDFFTEPSAAKSSAAKPSAAKSSAAKPHLAIPSTAKSSAAKPHHAIPSTAEPSFAKQSYNKPPVDNTPAGSKKRKNRKQKRHKTRTHSITNDIQNDIENGIEWKPECKPGEFESELEYHFQEYIPTDSIVSIKLDESEGIDEEEIEEADTDNDKNDETHRKKSVFDQKNKREIGKWGEARVYHTLEKNLMIKYPNGTKLDTIKGFKIEDEGKTLVEVIWYNKVAEKGVGSDIKVVENEIETFIDVKSTTTENKQWFDVTRRQWEQAKIAGSRYYIYRIFNAGTHFARIEIINDLYQKWKNEEIGVCPVKIKI